MQTFIHKYMCDHDFHGVFNEGCHYYPWATPIGVLVTFSELFAISVIFAWFIIHVVKPEPGCIFEGKVPFLPFYVGDPRGYTDPRYRTKRNGGTQ